LQLVLKSFFFLQYTPLCVAVESGHKDIVECLLKKGDKVNIKDDERVSIYYWQWISTGGWSLGYVCSYIRILIYHSKHLPSEIVVQNPLQSLIIMYFNSGLNLQLLCLTPSADFPAHCS